MSKHSFLEKLLQEKVEEHQAQHGKVTGPGTPAVYRELLTEAYMEEHQLPEAEAEELAQEHSDVVLGEMFFPTDPPDGNYWG